MIRKLPGSFFALLRIHLSHLYMKSAMPLRLYSFSHFPAAVCLWVSWDFFSRSLFWTLASPPNTLACVCVFQPRSLFSYSPSPPIPCCNWRVCIVNQAEKFTPLFLLYVEHALNLPTISYLFVLFSTGYGTRFCIDGYQDAKTIGSVRIIRTVEPAPSGADSTVLYSPW